MTHSASHRSTYSMSQTNLQLPEPGPAQKQQRRMTSPASNTSLNLPAEARRQPGRPPSPLRNTFVPDTSTGIHPHDSDEDEDDEDDPRQWNERSPSPSSSVSHLAASFKERVGTFLGSVAPRSPMSGSMPSDAELEAEAELERDRSRREAERILMREADERRRVEERVLTMMETTRSLPPPPSRSQTMPNPPSPSNSQKESQSWWTTAKNRLTPTKDLTPAQQVIQDAKTREKEGKKGKGKEKEERDELQYTDPVSLVPPPHRKPVPTSPSSPTPSRPSLSNRPPNLTPSPMRSMDGTSSSPSREAPPLYAQFNAQGTLDVPGTLLTVVKRFEKLEKWTVGHVRALEERMSDVERWLVDKEQVKSEVEGEAGGSRPERDLKDLKDGMAELQGRVSELGREMARLATSPSNLSSGPTSRQPGPPSIAPPTSSTILAHVDVPEPLSPLPPITPHVSSRFSTTARESTSPPITSSRSVSGTRLPYPTGDYGTPTPSEIGVGAGTFSPSHSPPSSLTRPLSIASTKGLVGLGISVPSSTPPSTSPAARATSPPTAAPRTLPPPPKTGSTRPTSVSPTPRKRYTVALGEPIVSPPDFGEPLSTSMMGTAFFSTWEGTTSENGKTDDAEGGGQANWNGSVGKRREEEFEDETIGRSGSARFMAGVAASPSPATKRRIRAQSTYAGFGNLQLPAEAGSESGSGQLPQTPITPLRPRIRSKSTERFGGRDKSGAAAGSGVLGGKFVDPLVLRRQEKGGTKGPVAMPKPLGRKVPVGQLVAFFDGEKRG